MDKNKVDNSLKSYYRVNKKYLNQIIEMKILGQIASLSHRQSRRMASYRTNPLKRSQNKVKTTFFLSNTEF